jgi:hypothetical protein
MDIEKEIEKLPDHLVRRAYFEVWVEAVLIPVMREFWNGN